VLVLLLEILQQDNAAHIVRDPQSSTTAYACFEAGGLREGLLESVSVPCYVMIRSGDRLKVAVVNPDLNQEEDPVKGHFNGLSKEAPVTLRLKGRWEADGDTKVAIDGNTTCLTVPCKEGLTVVTELVRMAGE